MESLDWLEWRGLDHLPVGNTPPNPLELVKRPAFGQLMREPAFKFDRVLVDAPAAVFGADAPANAAPCGDATIIAGRNASHVGPLRDPVTRFADGQVKQGGGAVVNESRA